MRSFAFFNGDCTIPGTGIATASKSTTTLKATITLNKNFTATSCCGIQNETPAPGYSIQLNWLDGDQNLNQVCVQAGLTPLSGGLNPLALRSTDVVIGIDWQPPNSPLKYTLSSVLPKWVWTAMFSAGTKVVLQTKYEADGSKSYDVQISDALGNSFDSGWLPFPTNNPAIITECVLGGVSEDMKATFAGLDATIQMEFTDANGMQYSVSNRSGDNNLNYGDVHNAYWRITGEDSNADQTDLYLDTWTFTQRSP